MSQITSMFMFLRCKVTTIKVFFQEKKFYKPIFILLIYIKLQNLIFKKFYMTEKSFTWHVKMAHFSPTSTIASIPSFLS